MNKECKFMQCKKKTSGDVKISVIIPVYNVEKYVEECLASVCSQSFKDIEILCIDDNSTDNSLAIIEKISKNDDRIKLFHNEKNMGLAYTRNVGLKNASGKYIAFIDSDDLYADGALKELFDLAESNNTDIVYFDAQCFFEDGLKYDKEKVDYYSRRKSYGLKSGRQMLFEMTFDNKFTDSACLLFIHKKWLDANRITFFSGILYEDCLFSTLCMVTANTVLHVNRKYYLYRCRANSILTSNQVRAEYIYSRAIIYREFLKLYCAHDFADPYSDGLLRMIVFIRENIRNLSNRLDDNEIEKLKAFKLGKYEKLAFEMSDFPITKIFSNSNFFKVLMSANKIEIYGAGVRARRLSEYLFLNNMGEKIKNFIVSSIGEQERKFHNINVYAVDEGYMPDKNSLIIISITGDDAYLIENKLRSEGIDKILILDNNTNASIIKRIKIILKI